MDEEERNKKDRRKYNQDRLLAGFPILTDNGIIINSPKLKQIYEIGEMYHNLYLSVCINKGLLPFLMESENKYANILNYDDSLMVCFLEGLKFFTGQQFIKAKEYFIVEGSDPPSYLCEDNFGDFIDLLELSNCAVERDTSKDIRNRELDRKIAEAKRKLNQRLGRKIDEDKITLSDLISVLASKHNNLNIMNIWDLTYYQFDNQFKRMQLIENYDIGVRQLLAVGPFGGIDTKNFNIEHYIKRI